ncbi:MAG: hypothetical protein HQ581_26345 [Planctomycetes bacterium]|nr:hypothetical protein [Planctomycetota bacterium]
MHVSGGTSRVWLARAWCAEAMTATAIKQRSDRVGIIIEPVVVVRRGDAPSGKPPAPSNRYDRHHSSLESVIERPACWALYVAAGGL